MIDKSIIEATSSWPFVEARKLVKERSKIYEKKGKITLQTGYGPSGLPHIGTFAEVARTTMMVNAIKQIINIDHHADNTEFGDLNIVHQISSVGELLTQLFSQLDWKISPEIASCLYAAIIFDTGKKSLQDTIQDFINLITSELNIK